MSYSDVRVERSKQVVALRVRCVALRCVALRCVALHCVALRCVALRCVYRHDAQIRTDSCRIYLWAAKKTERKR
jgi:hypothetical protein